MPVLTEALFKFIEESESAAEGKESEDCSGLEIGEGHGWRIFNWVGCGCQWRLGVFLRNLRRNGYNRFGRSLVAGLGCAMRFKHRAGGEFELGAAAFF